MTVSFFFLQVKTFQNEKSQDGLYLLLGLQFPGGCFLLLLRNLVCILSHRDLPLLDSHAPASAFWNPPLNGERHRYMMQQCPNQDSKRKATLSCCSLKKISAQLKILNFISKECIPCTMLRVAHSYTNLSNLSLKQFQLWRQSAQSYKHSM